MERTKDLEKLALLEQKKAREDKHRQTRLIAIKVTPLLDSASRLEKKHSGRSTPTQTTDRSLDPSRRAKTTLSQQHI